MVSASENNKRIAKNTVMLYFRMILLLLVSLYTSRVILNALGVEDYGIYNVVGGVVTMFSLLSSSLSSAISRFITFELGKGDLQRLKDVFSASVTIQIAISVIIVVLIEIIGVWFLNTHMVIPDDRMTAANWVLQFSVLTFVIGLISVPYNAAIIAHEHMSAFAYISILEAVGRLAVALLIVHSPIDRLIFFAGFVAVVGVIVRIVYGWYCKRHFSECTYHFRWDGALLRQMFSFAGWNFIGCAAGLFREQGTNILINLLFGPTVNAARAIAVKVNTVITGFVQNFMMALNPQITKSYASGDHAYMFTLIFQGARLSFYMLLFLSLPVIFSTHYILVLWLKLVPEHTVPFIQLALICAMSESLSNPLITAMLATGRIRNYQIVVGGLLLLGFPITYVCYKVGLAPEYVYVVYILISQCCLAARLLMLRGMINIKVREYLRKVYLNVIVVTIVAAIIPWLISRHMEECLSTFLIVSLISVVCSALTIYFIGCNNAEREKVRVYCAKLQKKVIKR